MTGNVRVTFDMDVKGLYSKDFFEKDLPRLDQFKITRLF